MNFVRDTGNFRIISVQLLNKRIIVKIKKIFFNSATVAQNKKEVINQVIKDINFSKIRISARKIRDNAGLYDGIAKSINSTLSKIDI